MGTLPFDFKCSSIITFEQISDVYHYEVFSSQKGLPVDRVPLALGKYRAPHF